MRFLEKNIIKLIFLFFVNITFGQNQWVHYTPNNSGLPGWTVTEMVIDSSNTKWIATNNGLARFRNNEWTVWDTNNSPLTKNFIESITIDKTNKLWLATSNKGIFKFDGVNWTKYYQTNIGYPLINVHKIRIDNFNNVWVCCYFLGLFKKITDTTWVRYYSGNSGLPHSDVNDVKFEGNIKWIGTVLGGIARFDDVHWAVFNTTNTPLESNFIEGIGIDNYNNKWFCTRFGGVAKFNTNQNQWNIFTSTNSGLPWGNTSTVFIDELNSKWIGIQDGGFVKYNDTTWSNFPDSNNATALDFKKDRYGNLWICEEGLTVYNPNGVVNIEKEGSIIPKSYIMLESNPNPFNAETKIKIYLPVKTYFNLIIYDITGKIVKIFDKQIMSQGKQEFILNANNLSSGIYFCVLRTTKGIKVNKIILLK